ncbi:MAG: Flp family type IVb pilin [Deinococcus-Thermus bacterium]|nr:Flp family type IVb pilin [Deinococcota bacterium]
MLKVLRHLIRKDDGASMVEYTVLLGLVLAVTIGTISAIGGHIEGAWNAVWDATNTLDSGKGPKG